MKILLKNGTLIDYKTNTNAKKDILIQDDRIAKIADEIEEYFNGLASALIFNIFLTYQ